VSINIDIFRFSLERTTEFNNKNGTEFDRRAERKDRSRIEMKLDVFLIFYSC